MVQIVSWLAQYSLSILDTLQLVLDKIWSVVCWIAQDSLSAFGQQVK